MLKLIISTFILFIITYTFNMSKTIYIMLFSILPVIMLSLFLLLNGFEFFSISIVTIYVGGIAVMFLFLILVIDMRSEEMGLEINQFQILWNIFFIILFVIIFYTVIIYFYNPLYFNGEDFELKVFKMEEISAWGDSIEMERIEFVEADELVLSIFDTFSDIYIIGFLMFKYFSIYVIAVGFFLLAATILAIMLCANIFR
jgi:NADH:ubiquinone oxidoreductase subunit 6 (subunit J)